MSTLRKIYPDRVEFFMDYDNDDYGDDHGVIARPEQKFIEVHQINCTRCSINTNRQVFYFIDGKEINGNWRNMTFHQLGIRNNSDIRIFV